MCIGVIWMNILPRMQLLQISWSQIFYAGAKRNQFKWIISIWAKAVYSKWNVQSLTQVQLVQVKCEYAEQRAMYSKEWQVLLNQIKALDCEISEDKWFFSGAYSGLIVVLQMSWKNFWTIWNHLKCITSMANCIHSRWKLQTPSQMHVVVTFKKFWSQTYMK